MARERRGMMKSTKEFWSKRQFTDSSSMEQWLLSRQRAGEFLQEIYFSNARACSLSHPLKLWEKVGRTGRTYTKKKVAAAKRAAVMNIASFSSRPPFFLSFPLRRKVFPPMSGRRRRDMASSSLLLAPFHFLNPFSLLFCSFCQCFKRENTCKVA